MGKVIFMEVCVVKEFGIDMIVFQEKVYIVFIGYVDVVMQLNCFCCYGMEDIIEFVFGEVCKLCGLGMVFIQCGVGVLYYGVGYFQFVVKICYVMLQCLKGIDGYIELFVFFEIGQSYFKGGVGGFQYFCSEVDCFCIVNVFIGILGIIVVEVGVGWKFDLVQCQMCCRLFIDQMEIFLGQIFGVLWQQELVEFFVCVGQYQNLISQCCIKDQGFVVI